MLSLARLALRWPKTVLLVLALGTAFAAAGLFRLQIRTDGAALYPEGDATVERTLADRERFHEPQQIIVLATSRPGGPPLASPAGFRWLQRLHADLQSLPGVEKPQGVRSLADLLEPPEWGILAIHGFLDEIPDDPAAFAALLARLDRFPVGRGLFLSHDGRTAPFYVYIDPKAERGAVIRDLETWRARQDTNPSNPGITLRITGPVAAEAVLGEVVLRDLSRLVPLMIAAIALLLTLTLRTPGGVVVPLAQVLATLVWTVGLMGWAGVPVTLVTTILPVLLMAMAMTDEVHLLERVQNRLVATPAPADRTPTPTPRERLLQVTSDAFADLNLPLVLTSLTTAFGFFSFAGSTMKPLRDFGIFAGLGLMLGMVFTFTLVPALMAVLPPSWSRRRLARQGGAAIPAWERFVASRGRAFALAGTVILIAAIPGVFRLSVQDSWVDNFDPRSPLVTAERDFNRAFWGSYRLDVVFEGDRRHFQTPEGVALLEDLDRLARQAPHVGGSLGPLLLLESGARVNGNPPPLSAAPPAAVKQAGLLIEVLSPRLDLRQYLTQDAAAARTHLFVPDADFTRGRELRDFLAARLPAIAARHHARFHLSGDLPTGLAVVGAIVGNQLESIGWVTVLIFVTLLVSFRSLRRTAVVMAPVLAATLTLFGALGYARIPLGIATSMFAALTLGAGVDFALHYAYAYWRERRAGRDHDGAVLATVATAGRGVLWNALVLAFGFLVLAFSALKPNASLGLLLAAAMLASYAATLVFLPELLRRFQSAAS